MATQMHNHNVVAHACASERKRARDRQPNPNHQTCVCNTNSIPPRTLFSDAIGQTNTSKEKFFMRKRCERNNLDRRKEREGIKNEKKALPLVNSTRYCYQVL